MQKWIPASWPTGWTTPCRPRDSGLLSQRAAGGRPFRDRTHYHRSHRQRGALARGCRARRGRGAGPSRLDVAQRGPPRHRHPPHPHGAGAEQRPESLRLPPAAGRPSAAGQQRPAGARAGPGAVAARRRRAAHLWPGQPRLAGRRPRPGDAGRPGRARARTPGREPLLVGDPSQPLGRVAWCTGGAQGMLADAVDAGATAYITGEVSESTVHLARETGVGFIGAGHHATERYGVQALGQAVAERFGIKVEFVDIDNPAIAPRAAPNPPRKAFHKRPLRRRLAGSAHASGGPAHAVQPHRIGQVSIRENQGCDQCGAAASHLVNRGSPRQLRRQPRSSIPCSPHGQALPGGPHDPEHTAC